MRVVRILIVVLIVAALAAAGFHYYLRPPLVQVTSPARGDAAQIVYANGEVEPATWAKVSPLSRGRIVEICDCEGKEIGKGDVLARLDDSQEQAVLKELEARQSLADAELKRLTLLAERNVVSIRDVDQARSEAAQLNALVAGQEAKIDELVLRAPMDGVILRQDGEVGEIAEPADTLFWVGQPTPLLVVADVNEEDIPRIEEGQRVLLRSDAFPDRALDATVARITPKGDPVTKTFRVRFALPADTPLRIGMTVDVNVVISVSKDALLVPVDAVANDRVCVLRGESLERVSVETGVRSEDKVEILSGLDEAARVVSPCDADMKDGTRVRVEGAA